MVETLARSTYQSRFATPSGADGEIPFTAGAFVGILFNPYTLLIAVNGAVGGLLTGYLLSVLTSVHKAIAAAIEIVIIAGLSWVFFGSDLSVFTIGSVAVVSVGVYLYSGSSLTDLLKLVTGGGGRDGGSVDGVAASSMPAPAADDERETAGLIESGKASDGAQTV
jgi:hypothetical protein